jgi:hypothetical protein
VPESFGITLEARPRRKSMDIVISCIWISSEEALGIPPDAFRKLPPFPPPSLYGIQHPIALKALKPSADAETDTDTSALPPDTEPQESPLIELACQLRLSR